MKPYLPFKSIGYSPLLSGLYRPGGRFSHQYPAATTAMSAATTAMCARENGRAPALPPPAATGGAVDEEPVFGTALTGASPRAALQLPQNLASAAFSNPHLHLIGCHLSPSLTVGFSSLRWARRAPQRRDSSPSGYFHPHSIPRRTYRGCRRRSRRLVVLRWCRSRASGCRRVAAPVTLHAIYHSEAPR